MNNKKIKLVFLGFSLLLLASLALADTYQFNNCGAEGRFGPDSGDCGYGGDNEVNIIGDGIQEWTVPETGIYEITAYGAEGGNDGTGPPRGAKSKGEVELSEGESIEIVVGQQGDYSGAGETCASGGGGSFVVRGDNSESLDGLIAIAGGGGGVTSQHSVEMSQAVGRSVANGGDMVGSSEEGGVLGESKGEDGSSGWNGAGGGFALDGEGQPEGGEAFVNGASGGVEDGSSSSCELPGGFGGGAGTTGVNSNGARLGGGGGAGGGANDCCSGESYAGGGGSFIDEEASNTDRMSDINSGHGFVEIEALEIIEADDPDIQTPLSPSKSQASSTSSPADIEFSVDVSIDDDGGNADDNTLDQCDVTATGQDNGGSVSPSTSITSSGTSGGTGTCEFSIDNDVSSSWEPGETIDVEVSVEDSYGGTDTISREHSFENTAPEVVDVSIVDDHVHGGFDDEVWGGENGVGLEVDVTDFESASTNTDVDLELDGGSIGSETVSNGDDTVLVDWERGGESDMDGFTRGSNYGVDATVFDQTGLSSSDSTSFTVLRPPALSDPSPTDGDGGDRLEVTADEFVVDVDSDIDGFDVEFRVDDGTEDYQVKDTQTVSGGDGAASVDISDFEFRNEPEGGEGEWYVKVQNDYSTTDFSQRETTYSFAAQTASLQIQTGDGENLNPGSADIGGSDLEFVMDNEGNGGLDRAEFLIDGEVFEAVEPVPEGETVSADIRQEVSSKDMSFDWGVRLVDNGDVVEEESGLEFSTHVVDASWTDTSAAGVPAEFNIYYSNEDGVFDFGSQDYEKLGTTRDTEISLAPSDLGRGSDDCFRVSAENSGGESSDSSPPISDDGVCVGGEIN